MDSLGENSSDSFAGDGEPVGRLLKEGDEWYNIPDIIHAALRGVHASSERCRADLAAKPSRQEVELLLKNTRNAVAAALKRATADLSRQRKDEAAALSALQASVRSLDAAVQELDRKADSHSHSSRKQLSNELGKLRSHDLPALVTASCQSACHSLAQSEPVTGIIRDQVTAALREQQPRVEEMIAKAVSGAVAKAEESLRAAQQGLPSTPAFEAAVQRKVDETLSSDFHPFTQQIHARITTEIAGAEKTTADAVRHEAASLLSSQKLSDVIRANSINELASARGAELVRHAVLPAVEQLVADRAPGFAVEAARREIASLEEGIKTLASDEARRLADGSTARLAEALRESLAGPRHHPPAAGAKTEETDEDRTPGLSDPASGSRGGQLAAAAAGGSDWVGAVKGHFETLVARAKAEIEATAAGAERRIAASCQKGAEAAAEGAVGAVRSAADLSRQESRGQLDSCRRELAEEFERLRSGLEQSLADACGGIVAKSETHLTARGHLAAKALNDAADDAARRSSACIERTLRDCETKIETRRNTVCSELADKAEDALRTVDNATKQRQEDLTRKASDWIADTVERSLRDCEAKIQTRRNTVCSELADKAEDALRTVVSATKQRQEDLTRTSDWITDTVERSLRDCEAKIEARRKTICSELDDKAEDALQTVDNATKQRQEDLTRRASDWITDTVERSLRDCEAKIETRGKDVCSELAGKAEDALRTVDKVTKQRHDDLTRRASDFITDTVERSLRDCEAKIETRGKDACLELSGKAQVADGELRELKNAIREQAGEKLHRLREVADDASQVERRVSEMLAERSWPQRPRRSPDWDETPGADLADAVGKLWDLRKSELRRDLETELVGSARFQQGVEEACRSALEAWFTAPEESRAPGRLSSAESHGAGYRQRVAAMLDARAADLWERKKAGLRREIEAELAGSGGFQRAVEAGCRAEVEACFSSPGFTRAPGSPETLWDQRKSELRRDLETELVGSARVQQGVDMFGDPGGLSYAESHGAGYRQRVAAMVDARAADLWERKKGGLRREIEAELAGSGGFQRAVEAGCRAEVEACFSSPGLTRVPTGAFGSAGSPETAAGLEGTGRNSFLSSSGTGFPPDRVVRRVESALEEMAEKLWERRRGDLQRDAERTILSSGGLRDAITLQVRGAVADLTDDARDGGGPLPQIFEKFWGKKTGDFRREAERQVLSSGGLRDAVAQQVRAALADFTDGGGPLPEIFEKFWGGKRGGFQRDTERQVLSSAGFRDAIAANCAQQARRALSDLADDAGEAGGFLARPLERWCATAAGASFIKQKAADALADPSPANPLARQLSSLVSRQLAREFAACSPRGHPAPTASPPRPSNARSSSFHFPPRDGEEAGFSSFSADSGASHQKTDQTNGLSGMLETWGRGVAAVVLEKVAVQFGGGSGGDGGTGVDIVGRWRGAVEEAVRRAEDSGSAVAALGERVRQVERDAGDGAARGLARTVSGLEASASELLRRFTADCSAAAEQARRDATDALHRDTEERCRSAVERCAAAQEQPLHEMAARALRSVDVGLLIDKCLYEDPSAPDRLAKLLAPRVPYLLGQGRAALKAAAVSALLESLETDEPTRSRLSESLAPALAAAVTAGLREGSAAPPECTHAVAALVSHLAPAVADVMSRGSHLETLRSEAAEAAAASVESYIRSDASHGVIDALTPRILANVSDRLRVLVPDAISDWAARHARELADVVSPALLPRVQTFLENECGPRSPPGGLSALVNRLVDDRLGHNAHSTLIQQHRPAVPVDHVDMVRQQMEATLSNMLHFKADEAWVRELLDSKLDVTAGVSELMRLENLKTNRVEAQELLSQKATMSEVVDRLKAYALKSEVQNWLSALRSEVKAMLSHRGR
ncbi:hypothetical protein DIPPA_34645 [Diplonema papillatum]|nr:hypothetical protein DIPPA_34645 [Diplonema papillatum]